MGNNATKLLDRLRDWGRDRLNVLELKELLDIVGPAVVDLERQLKIKSNIHEYGPANPVYFNFYRGDE